MNSLGICIPTYKRPDYLRRCVLSALEAAGDRSVRIFIADDSMDNTNAVLYAELQSLSDAVVVHRNSVNLGIDENIQRAIDLCDCDYAWIVGEDDYFLPGSVQRVFDLLQHDNHSFVFANYAYVGDNNQDQIGQALDLSQDELPGADFVDMHLWAAGFIGACIVRLDCWRHTSAASYAGTYYTHVGRICELLAEPDAKVKMIAAPCVANRVEGTETFTWRNDSYGVYFGFQAMCETVARLHPTIAAAARNAAKVMERRYGWLSLRVAMRLRSDLAYDHGQYKRYIAPSIANPLKRLAFLLISVTPPSALRPLVIAYRRIRR